MGFTLLASLLVTLLLLLGTGISLAYGLHRRTGEARQRLQRVRGEMAEALPGIAEGKVATWRISRREMALYMDEDMQRRIGVPSARIGIPEFRALCHECSYAIFDKWINEYSTQTIPVCRRIRFNLTFDGGATYHWWELIYQLDEVTCKQDSFCGVLVNIDEVKDIEYGIELARQKKYEVELKETFLAAINHDLRTPLNAVSGFSTLLAEQYELFSDEERKEFASIVQSNSDSMLKLMEDTMSVTRADVGQLRFKVRPYGVNDIMNVVYRTNTIVCPSHLEFRYEVPTDGEQHMVVVDPKRVEQVVNNLVSNAFKFTQMGYVKLGWRHLDDTDEVEIYVTDTGIGVSEGNQKHIFEQFFRVNEQAHGTGLGLNICKNMVEKMGGTIGVSSVVNEGSTFWCRFPLYHREGKEVAK